MKIIEITDERADEYKAFFITGLQEHPDCFRISAADEVNEPFPTKANPYSFTLAAVDENDRLAGIVSFKREVDNREKLAHKGLLFRMYVASHQAGKGLGALLITALLQRVENLNDIKQINLTLAAHNTRAKNLYTRFGFQLFGTETRAIKLGAQFLDEDMMVLHLS